MLVTYFTLICVLSLSWSLNNDEKYYYKLTKNHYEIDWLECCNDKFYPDEIHKGATDFYNQCKGDLGEDKSACFHTCFLRKMGVYDETGFHKDGWMKQLGPDKLLGDANDWKKKVAETIIDHCFQEIDQKATHDCNEDLRCSQFVTGTVGSKIVPV